MKGTLSLIYLALNNTHVIQSMIRKERILQYPAGSWLAGVQREFDLGLNISLDQKWIRSIEYYNDTGFVITCCDVQQARAFVRQPMLEMDLSFKMVRGKTNLYSLKCWYMFTPSSAAHHVLPAWVFYEHGFPTLSLQKRPDFNVLLMWGGSPKDKDWDSEGGL